MLSTKSDPWLDHRNITIITCPTVQALALFYFIFFKFTRFRGTRAPDDSPEINFWSLSAWTWRARERENERESENKRETCTRFAELDAYSWCMLPAGRPIYGDCLEKASPAWRQCLECWRIACGCLSRGALASTTLHNVMMKASEGGSRWRWMILDERVMHLLSNRLHE